MGSSAKEVKETTAKLFRNGRSQAVRLPKEFRFEGNEVRIRRDGKRVVLESMNTDVKAWLRKLDSFRGEPFMPEGRNQPEMPVREALD
jgi:antitoxin VapB